jgi:hypothetical protein
MANPKKVDLGTEFVEEITGLWGSPQEVARAALQKMFNIRYQLCLGSAEIICAMEIGLLAGELKDEAPATFIEKFTETLSKYI